MLDAITHAGLSSKVDDDIGLEIRHLFDQGVTVFEHLRDMSEGA